MKGEWIRRIVSGLLQVAAMTGLLTWLLVADVVPWRSVLLSVTPLLGLWAGRALGSAADCLLEWHRLRREIRICVDWRDVKP